MIDIAERPALQQPEYPNPARLERVVHRLGQMPGLVTPLEIRQLKAELARAAAGKAFVLQGGDCAERFAETNPARIRNRIRVMLQMSLVLVHGLGLPIIRIGRFAGQYAKPRSEALETVDGVSLPSYRGDIINGPAFTEAARIPDPSRMLKAYYHSASTLNYVRALGSSGFADLQTPEKWGEALLNREDDSASYVHLVRTIKDALRFLSTINGDLPESIRHVRFYTGHEALLLPYEEAMTRSVDGHRYNVSAHAPWIGLRTHDPDGAHVAYAASIANPISIKIGPDTPMDAVFRMLDRVDPEHEPGRIALTTRMGAARASDALPDIIRGVRAVGREVLWICDPMHGNTRKTASGHKTRSFEDILSDVQQTMAVHRELGSHLGGLHFELTGDAVTECTGGYDGPTDNDLHQAYRSLVDPRLNGAQALEMAFRVVEAQQSLPR